MKNQIEVAGILVGVVQSFTLNDKPAAKFKIKVSRELKGADTFVCVIDDSRILKRVSKLIEGAKLDVSGRLEVRFFRVGSAIASATEIRVESLRKI